MARRLLSGSSYYDREVRADARKGRGGAEMALDLMTREFKGESARGLGKGGDKVKTAIEAMAVAEQEVERAKDVQAKLRAIAKYNALWKTANVARQNLVIQREAATAGARVGGMRVDVIKGAMSDGPGASADEVVRKQYPIPRCLDENGNFVVLASEAYTG